MTIPVTYSGLYMSWGGGSSELLFDATVRDSSESVLAVTDHPVEAGPNVFDNARLELKKFNYQVFVSNAPIYDWNSRGSQIIHTQLNPTLSGQALNVNPVGAAVGAISALLNSNGPYDAITLQWQTPFDAVKDTLGQLLDLQVKATLIDIATPKYTQKNCLLTRASMERTSQEGTGAIFNLEFKEVRQVTLATSDSPLSTNPQDTAPKNKGAKANTQVDTSSKDGVAITGLKDALKLIRSSL